jgi:hypothetical protein
MKAEKNHEMHFPPKALQLRPTDLAPFIWWVTTVALLLLSLAVSGRT